ncbi:MAG: hypothetical protein JOY52_11670, partial [Hyphomicrobiales bacterium]|nr:hypothetical protein [Acidobacteriaceae bacterium]MBV9908208.1 hypothetical protein [Hyphomicrobiales bacterium]
MIGTVRDASSARNRVQISGADISVPSQIFMKARGSDPPGTFQAAILLDAIVQVLASANADSPSMLAATD